MKLNEKQKRIINLINDDQYTVDQCEKYWNANAAELMDQRRINWSFYVLQIKEVNAFMRAVNGIIKILEDRAEKAPEIN